MLRFGLDRHFAQYCRTGDARALARVFDGAAAELYRLGYHLLGDRHAAEDLVQQTFVTAIEARESFAAERRVMPWLCGILTHRALHQRRQRRQRLQQDHQLPAAMDQIVDPATEASRAELQAAVLVAIRALPDPYRQPLLLHLGHDLTPKEVAEALALPPATVRTQLARGLEMLRRRLPASLAASAYAVPVPLGLTLVRDAVLQFAHSSPVSGALATAASFGSTLAAGIAMKKSLLAVLFVLVCLGIWPWLQALTQPVDAGTAPNTSELATIAATAPQQQPGSANTTERTAVAGPGELPTGLEVVVHWADGTPAAAVNVRCRPDTPQYEPWLRASVTNAAGLARFRNLPEGACLVSTDRSAPLQVTVVAGTNQQVMMQLEAGLDVRGRVVDRDEHPIGGATIWMSVVANSDDAEAIGTAAADGTFTIRGTHEGHLLTATAPGFGSHRVEPVTKRHRDEELLLRLARAPGSLVVLVHDPRGRPIANARLLVGVSMTQGRNHTHFGGGIIGQDVMPSRFLRTDDLGLARTEGLPALPWPVWVGAPGFAAARQVVDVSADRETKVTFGLDEGATLFGSVRDTASEVPPDTEVSVDWQFPAMHTLINPLGEQGGFLAGAPLFVATSTRADAEGQFELAHVMPGTVTLRAFSGRSLSHHDERELRAHERVQWDPVLQDDAERPHFFGAVTTASGKPLSQWTVTVRRPGWDTDFGTDRSGNFRGPPIQDGTYRMAVKAGYPCIGRDFDAGTFRPADSPLRIVVPDEFEPTASLKGRILVPQGRPCEACVVSVALVGERNWGTGVKTAEDGSYAIAGLAEGDYVVRVDDSSFGAIQVGRFVVQHGAVVDVGTFTVPLPGRLEVEIVDSAARRRLDSWLVTVPLGPPTVRRYHGLRHDQGLATGNVQPGRWRIESWQPMPFASIQCEVLPGRTTRVQLVVPDGQRFVLRVPRTIERASEFTMFWRDASGEVLRQTSLDMRAPGTDVEQFAAPGTYTLTVRAPDGGEATTKVTIPIGGAPQVVEFPLPAPK